MSDDAETRELTAPTHAHYGWKHARELERELAAANEAMEKAIGAYELLSGTRDIAHAGNVSAAMQSVADERDALRAEVERLREDAERLSWYESNHSRVGYAWETGEWVGIDSNGDAHQSKSIRTAIDAARKGA